jgi:hypothetical protein
MVVSHVTPVAPADDGPRQQEHEPDASSVKVNEPNATGPVPGTRDLVVDLRAVEHVGEQLLGPGEAVGPGAGVEPGGDAPPDEPLAAADPRDGVVGGGGRSSSGRSSSSRRVTTRTVTRTRRSRRRPHAPPAGDAASASRRRRVWWATSRSVAGSITR